MAYRLLAANIGYPLHLGVTVGPGRGTLFSQRGRLGWGGAGRAEDVASR